ncbi:MAG: hypothetical protein RSA64_06105 [Christensenellaceae bacterium]
MPPMDVLLLINDKGQKNMRKYSSSKSNKGSIAVMFSALTLLALCLANTLPILRVAFYFIASFFVMGIMMERSTLAALISFVAVLFIGFLIVPDKVGMFPYLFFFGHYGIFKYLIDESKSGLIGMVLKLVYFNIGFALIFFFTNGWMTELLPFAMPWWLVVILAEIIFVIYDFIFSKLANSYYAHARNRLVNTGRY